MDETAIEELVRSLYPHLDDTALQHTVASTFHIKKPKATKLITAGERHPYYYLIIKGSVKTYYLRDSKQVCYRASRGFRIPSVRNRIAY